MGCDGTAVLLGFAETPTWNGQELQVCQVSQGASFSGCHNYSQRSCHSPRWLQQTPLRLLWCYAACHLDFGFYLTTCTLRSGPNISNRLENTLLKDYQTLFEHNASPAGTHHRLGPNTKTPPCQTQCAHLSAIREEESSAPLTPLWSPLTPSESRPVSGLHQTSTFSSIMKTMSSFQCNPDCCQMYSCYHDYYFFCKCELECDSYDYNVVWLWLYESTIAGQPIILQ